MTPSYSLIIFIHLILREYYVVGTSVSPRYRWKKLRHRMIKKLVQVTHLVSGTPGCVYHHASKTMYVFGWVYQDFPASPLPHRQPLLPRDEILSGSFLRREDLWVLEWLGPGINTYVTMVLKFASFYNFPCYTPGWLTQESKVLKKKKKPKDLKAVCSYEKKQKVEVPTFTQSLLLGSNQKRLTYFFFLPAATMAPVKK